VKGKVLAHEDSQANGATEAKGFVMAVAQAYGEPAALEAGAEVHHPEHLHAVRRHGVFFPHHANLAKAEGFDQLLDDGDMWNWFVRCCASWRWHSGQFLSGELVAVGAQRHGRGGRGNLGSSGFNRLVLLNKICFLHGISSKRKSGKLADGVHPSAAPQSGVPLPAARRPMALDSFV
jgi:hypothetical protein